MTQGVTVLATGGAGFIGSAFVRAALSAGAKVVTVDALTYAGGRDNLPDNPNHVFVHADVCDAPAMARVFAQHEPDWVVHLAAESHVDRSIDGPAAFVRTNLVGTSVLLEAARAHWADRPPGRREGVRFLHVSTDEVFGALGPQDPAFHEDTPYAPTSPYSASKAGADHLARAWGATYGLPVLVSNCSNNYGPRQYPEKLIPVIIAKALAGEPIPLYGDGRQVRDWLYVDDHAAALLAIVENGRPGRTYAVGARCEVENRVLADHVCAILDRLAPRLPAAPYAELVDFVKDRPAHDARYAIDPSRIQDELGWRPATSLADGLEATVRWYLDHEDWVRARLGEATPARLGQVEASPMEPEA